MKNNTDLSTEKEVILKTKKKVTPLTISLVIISFVAIISLYVFFKNYNLVSSYSNKVYPGIYVLNKDLSSLTSEELLNELNLLSDALINKTIKATFSDKEFTLTYDELEYKLNVNELSEQILAYGKDNSFFTKLKLIKEPQNKEFNFTFTYNDEALNTFIDKIYDDLYLDPINASIDISYGNINVSEEVSGLELNSDKLKEDLIASLEDFTVDSDVNITLETKAVNPSITSEALSTVNRKLSSFSTKFIYGPSGTNLQKATYNIDNNIIMPGETYSTDKSIGPTTLERGFVYSNTYVGGEVVKGLGGGVCQVSSTLYNTILHAGIIPIERMNHMMPVGYIGIGLDATLADNLIDLKFVNDTEYPMVINSTAENGILTIELWSNEANDDGINYETYREFQSELSVDTYLHGYDSAGNLVFNQYLDRSTYEPLPTN